MEIRPDDIEHYRKAHKAIKSKGLYMKNKCGEEEIRAEEEGGVWSSIGS